MLQLFKSGLFKPLCANKIQSVTLLRMVSRTCTLVVVLHLFAVAFSASVEKIENFTAHYDAIYPTAENRILQQEKLFWMKDGLEHLQKVLAQEEDERHHVAKNVILFIGDGMGTTTTTAARVYKGQRYFGEMGEEHDLSFDKFPNVALVKTYNVDRQVPDSAGTATALFTGVKSRFKAIGVDVKSNVLEFDRQVYEESKLDSFMVWAQAVGKDTGIVTTTRITHATPAASYARINNRDWECDTEVPEKYRKSVKDIAKQLIEDEPGKNYKVILGGGQQQLGYVEYVKEGKCSRGDGINLTEVWINNHQGSNTVFAVNNGDLEKVTDDTEYLLGLFDPNHMPFELTRNKNSSGSPSLTDMTRKALQVLKKNLNGFVLMVEGGLIDQAHHKNYARLAMGETAEFDNAISLALNLTGPETLILVTSDHSHAFTMNGYAKRGNDILGFGNETVDKDVPYLTLSYGNGPGFDYHYNPNDTSARTSPWRDVTVDENRLNDPWYQHLGSFTREDETHGGEDVPIYAKGPNSHLIRGVIEQNYVAHVVSYAACIGPRAYLNKYCPTFRSNAASKVQQSYLLVLGIVVYHFY